MRGARTSAPEFIIAALRDWTQRRHVELPPIQPEKPVPEPLIERFTRTYSTEALDQHVFTNLVELSRVNEYWRNR